MLRSLRSKLFSLKSIFQVYDNWLGILKVYLLGGETRAFLNDLHGGRLPIKVSKDNVGRIISVSNVLVKFKDLGYEVRNDETMCKIIKTLTHDYTKEELSLLWVLRVLSVYVTGIVNFDDNYNLLTDVDGVKWIVRKASPVSLWGDALFGPLLKYYQEPEEYGWLSKALHDGGVFVDVGANVGGFSVRACKIGARVIAVEPSPDNFQVLKLNLELNQCINANALNIAAGRREEIRELFGDSSTVGYSLIQGEEKAVRGLVEVKPLDVAIPALLGDEWVDLLKVDVEGSEVEVIKSASDLLKRTRYIIVEVIPGTKVKIRQMLDLLASLGFVLIDKICRQSLYCDLFLRRDVNIDNYNNFRKIKIKTQGTVHSY